MQSLDTSVLQAHVAHPNTEPPSAVYLSRVRMRRLVCVRVRVCMCEVRRVEVLRARCV